MMIDTKNEEEANRMPSPLPRKVKVAATNDAPASAAFTMAACDKTGESNPKRRRRFSFNNLYPRNIPDPAECIGICGNKKDGRTDYLPTFEETQIRAKIVQRLQQQIRNLEKELATKMKEEKAKNDASSWPSFAGRKRKSCSM